MFRAIRKANLTYRNIRRLRVIVGIFMRHGLYGLMERAQLHLLIPIHRRIKKKILSEKKEIFSVPKRLRLAFGELGPTFIKFGQLIASRPDLVPEEFGKEFNKLLDEVPPFTFREVKKLIEDEFSMSIFELFREFEEQPVAAASIAQVHKAVLHDGTLAVVKVQRPNIENIISADIELMRIMAKLIEKYIPETKAYNPTGIVVEFSRAIKKEMDFTLEASNMVNISRNFKTDETVVIPEVYWDLSTSKALTLERIEGIRIDDMESLKKKCISGSKIASLLTDCLFAQIFKFGTFHGDLHAGNIFVIEENRLGFVDFGIVGRVSDEMRENLANVFIAIVKEDYNLLVESYLDMGIVPENTDLEALKRDSRDLLEAYLSRPVKDAKLGKLLFGYSQIALNYSVVLPDDLVLLEKCILELEGIVRQLDPNFNLLEAGKGYAGELLKLWYSPKRVSRDMFKLANDIDKTVKVLPSQIRQLMQKMLNDKFTIDFVHIGLEQLTEEIDRSSSRLSLGLIIAALIVGSSLIMLTGKGPLFMGLPLFGFAGFSAAGLLGLLLAIVIIKSRKL